MEHTEAAEAAINILNERGITTELFLLHDEWSPDELKRNMEKALAKSPRNGQTGFNLSGANPVAAVIGTTLFRERKQPVFVVAPDSDEIIWLSLPEGQSSELPINVEDRLKIIQAISIHGLKVAECWQWLHKPETHWDEICRQLVAESVRIPETLAKLGSCCRAANVATWLSQPLPMTEPGMRRLRDIVIDSGLASVAEGNRLRLSNRESIDFLAGCWLEHHVLMAARVLHEEGRIQDAACGLIVEVAPEVLNELDGVILSNNQLLLIECKARKGTNANRHTGIGVDSIYKMDSLRQMRTLLADGLLVTLAKPSESEAARLEIEEIATVAGAALPELANHLRDLLEK